MSVQRSSTRFSLVAFSLTIPVTSYSSQSYVVAFTSTMLPSAAVIENRNAGAVGSFTLALPFAVAT
jgi:hypothetical protein